MAERKRAQSIPDRLQLLGSLSQAAMQVGEQGSRAMDNFYICPVSTSLRCTQAGTHAFGCPSGAS